MAPSFLVHERILVTRTTSPTYLRLPVLLAGLLLACDAPEPNQPPLPTATEQPPKAVTSEGTPSEDPMQTWEHAEAAATTYLQAKHGLSPVGVSNRYESLPYLLGIWVKPDVGELVLVSEGEVVQAQGVDALSAYLKTIELLSRPAPLADDFLVLVQHLDAWPPMGDPQKQKAYFESAGVRSDLDPSFRHSPTGAKLTLHYEHQSSQTRIEGLSIGAGGQVASPRKFERWTLTIGPDYAAKWESEPMSLDP